MDIKLGNTYVPSQYIADAAPQNERIKIRSLAVEDSFRTLQSVLNLTIDESSTKPTIEEYRVFNFFTDKFRRFARIVPVLGFGVLALDPNGDGGAIFSGNMSMPSPVKPKPHLNNNYLYDQEVVRILTDDESNSLNLLARHAAATLAAEWMFGFGPYGVQPTEQTVYQVGKQKGVRMRGPALHLTRRFI